MSRNASDTPRCGARTRAGRACRAGALPGRDCCVMHSASPDEQARRGRLGGLRRAASAAKEARERQKPVQLRTVDEMRAWLERLAGLIETGDKRALARVTAAAKVVGVALELHGADVRAELDQIREAIAAATGQPLGALASLRLSS